MKKGFVFEGFEPANTTPVPDVLFDVLLPHLSGAELKVLLYVIRRTTGFKKTTDTISFTQFEKGIITKDGRVLDRGCGLSRETISQALAGLEAKGCIKSHKRNTTSGDKDTSAYSVRFKHDVVGKTDYPTWSEKPTTLVGKSDYRGQINRLPVVGKSDIQETVIQDTDSQETVIQEGTYGANAPTHADISLQREKVEKRITHPRIEAVAASMLSDSQVDIGNEEEDTAPRLEAVKIGASHATGHHTELSSGGDRGTVHSSSPGMADRPIDTSEHTPGTPAPLPLATVPPGSRHSDAGSAQATRSLLLGPEPAQAGPPAAGNVVLPQHAPTAQASGASVHKTKAVAIPERPKNVKKLPVMPEPPKTVTLTPQEAAFWALWCGVFFNKDIAPHLTVTAYGHIKQLAPHITSAEQMESLVKKARQDLEDNTGVKRKTVYLGNCVNSYPGWLQEQAAQGPPEEKPPMDKYTAASRDKERLERGLQRLRDLTIAEGRGGELPK